MYRFGLKKSLLQCDYRRVFDEYTQPICCFYCDSDGTQAVMLSADLMEAFPLTTAGTFFIIVTISHQMAAKRNHSDGFTCLCV